MPSDPLNQRDVTDAETEKKAPGISFSERLLCRRRRHGITAVDVGNTRGDRHLFRSTQK
jgi:hypothetical protein